MPNLLSNLINPKYDITNYPGREQALSRIAGSGYGRAPSIPQAPSTAMQPRPQEYAWQREGREEKERSNIKAALTEIVETRDKTGQSYLSPMERMQIFLKYKIPQQVAEKFNSIITTEQTKAERKYTISTTDVSGRTTSRLVGKEELVKGIVTKEPTKKDVMWDKILSEEIDPTTLSPIKKAWLGIKTKDPKVPTVKKMGDIWWQWNPETKVWDDTGKKEEEKPKAPTMRAMYNKKGEWNDHRFDPEIKDWVDTGRSAEKPTKEGKPKYDLKSVTDYYKKHAYDKDGDFVGLNSNQEETIKYLIEESGVSFELVEKVIPAEERWWGFVQIPEEKVSVLQRTDLTSTEKKPAEWDDAEVAEILRKAGMAITPENILKFKAQN